MNDKINKKGGCVYYVSSSGRVPVRDFIDSLAFRTQQKFFAVIEMLVNFGKNLPDPHAKLLTDEIYELRFKGQEGNIRILYFFFDGWKIVLVNGFIKKSARIPKKYLRLAEQRKRAYFNRGK